MQWLQRECMDMQLYFAGGFLVNKGMAGNGCEIICISSDFVG